MRRFNSIFLVPITLLFSLAASYFIMAVSGQKEVPPDQPLANYRDLYRNYRLFTHFLELPQPTPPPSIEDMTSMTAPPFITDLLTLKTAAANLKDKNDPELQNTLLHFSPSHPFLIEKKRTLYLRYLYQQKKYQEYIQHCQTYPPTSPESKLILLNCATKTANTTLSHTIFLDLFPTQPLLILEKYIPRPQLLNFLKKIPRDSWFKKLQFLAKNNRYESFLKEKKYLNLPQLVALFQAEFEYNSKDYTKCKKSLALVTDTELEDYKKILLLKMQLREKQYDTLFESLTALEKNHTLYMNTLLNCGGILLIDGKTDLALQVYSKYTQTLKAMYFTLNALLNRNDILIHEENYWKSLWLCAWLGYQKNDKVLATAFFKEGIHATDHGFKMASRYWLQRVAPSEAAQLEMDLAPYPFSYYYTRQNPSSDSLAQSQLPFIRMFNHPRSAQANGVIALVKSMAQYQLLDDANAFIQWSLQDPSLTLGDKHVLKLLQSILYLKQGNENMAFIRFRRNFENYYSFLLPRFLRQIIMPVKYEAIVQKYAAENDIDSALLFSLIREESFFRANVVSYAKAYGLMQLLLPTARQMATPHNIRLKESDLYDAEINIRFGTQYLRQLLDKYHGKVHLALAAYNAGDFRVDVWLNRFGDVADDEFIEMIPFTATRTYVKNILRNDYYYRYYYGKESMQ